MAVNARSPTLKAPAGTVCSAFESPWTALAVYPIERAGRGLVEQTELHRNQVAGGDEEPVAFLNADAMDDAHDAVFDLARQQAFGTVVGEQLGTIAFEHPLLKPASDEHERDEHRERVDVRSMPGGKEERVGRAGKREDDPESDRYVQMKNTPADGPSRRADEYRAADQDRECTGRVAELIEELVDGAFAEPQVDRGSKEHDIARQGCADPDAQQAGRPTLSHPWTWRDRAGIRGLRPSRPNPRAGTVLRSEAPRAQVPG